MFSYLLVFDQLHSGPTLLKEETNCGIFLRYIEAHKIHSKNDRNRDSQFHKMFTISEKTHIYFKMHRIAPQISRLRQPSLKHIQGIPSKKKLGNLSDQFKKLKKLLTNLYQYLIRLIQDPPERTANRAN